MNTHPINLKRTICFIDGWLNFVLSRIGNISAMLRRYNITGELFDLSEENALELWKNWNSIFSVCCNAQHLPIVTLSYLKMDRVLKKIWNICPSNKILKYSEKTEIATNKPFYFILTLFKRNTNFPVSSIFVVGEGQCIKNKMTWNIFKIRVSHL